MVLIITKCHCTVMHKKYVRGRQIREEHPSPRSLAEREAETRLVADCHLWDKEHTEIMTGCEGCTEDPGWTHIYYIYGLKSKTVCLNKLPEAQFKVHGRKQPSLGRSLCELAENGINHLLLLCTGNQMSFVDRVI